MYVMYMYNTYKQKGFDVNDKKMYKSYSVLHQYVHLSIHVQYVKRGSYIRLLNYCPTKHTPYMHNNMYCT